MARDPLERRQFTSTAPEDLNDPPQFGQMVETAKDLVVLRLREYMRQQGISVERRDETPIIDKFATTAAGTDPYETYLQIVQEHPDINERLPHVAVTATSLTNARMGMGRPVVAVTQAPPRVETTIAGPYALADVQNQEHTIVANTGPAATYSVVIQGIPISTLVSSGTTADALRAVDSMIRANFGLLMETTLLPDRLLPTSLALRVREPGLVLTVAVSANLTLTLVQAASVATEPNKLVYRTTPDNINVTTSTVTFAPRRFSTSMASVSAADIARVFNEQALYAEARVINVGIGSGVRFQTGGVFGNTTPNEIEILPDSKLSLVTALGLGNYGTVGVGASVAGIGPSYTLVVPGAGFTAAMIGRYVTLDGTVSNDGHFLITAVGGATTLTFTNEDTGAAEVLPAAATWFIGLRDTWENTARPVQNRYHGAVKVTINILVIAESTNERRELTDLIWNFFTFALEEQHFTLLGRGVFDEAYPDEHIQLAIHQEETASDDLEFPRPGGTKLPIQAARITVPCTLWHFLDRQVLVPSGPSTGASWVVTSDDISADDGVLGKS